MLERLRAVLDREDGPKPNDGAADAWDAARRLTDAETPAEFSHELYVDSTSLERALAGRSPTRSLEVGCGYGRLTPWIAERAAEHHAVDPDRVLLSAAAAAHPGVRFHCARVEALPFPDDAFDLAVTWGVLNHVPSSLIDAATAELDRVVGADGTLVVSEATDGTPDPRWEYRSVGEWRDRFEPRRLDRCEHTDRDREPFRDPDREHVVMTFR